MVTLPSPFTGGHLAEPGAVLPAVDEAVPAGRGRGAAGLLPRGWAGAAVQEAHSAGESDTAQPSPVRCRSLDSSPEPQILTVRGNEAKWRTSARRM